MPTKRRRTTTWSGVGRSTRPIDKNLKVIHKSPITDSQVSTTLVTSTYPCTITGIRWNLSASNHSAASVHNVFWALILVKDGNIVSTMSTSDAASFYEPEQNVLAFGVSDIGVLDQVTWNDKTKTMRKVMAGDQVQLIAISDSAANTRLKGVVQFFCKT